VRRRHSRPCEPAAHQLTFLAGSRIVSLSPLALYVSATHGEFTLRFDSRRFVAIFLVLTQRRTSAENRAGEPGMPGSSVEHGYGTDECQSDREKAARQGRNRCRSRIIEDGRDPARRQAIHSEGCIPVFELSRKRNMVAQNDDQKQESRPPTVDDLVGLCRELNARRAEYIVIGGMAMINAGFVRTTETIDLLIESSASNQAKVRQALSVLPDNAVREM